MTASALVLSSNLRFMTAEFQPRKKWAGNRQASGDAGE
jgi:hypothetical protein